MQLLGQAILLVMAPVFTTLISKGCFVFSTVLARSTLWTALLVMAI